MSRGWGFALPSASDGFLRNATGHVEGILSRPGTDVHLLMTLASNLSPCIRTVNVQSGQGQGQCPPCPRGSFGVRASGFQWNKHDTTCNVKFHRLACVSLNASRSRETTDVFSLVGKSMERSPSFRLGRHNSCVGKLYWQCWHLGPCCHSWGMLQLLSSGQPVL